MLPGIVKLLIKAGQCAPSADNSQPWCFTWDGDVLSLCYDSQRVAGRTFGVLSPATLLGIGCVMENLSQVLAGLGQAAEWDILTPEPANNHCYLKLRPNPEIRISDDTDSYPLFNRHTNRLPYSEEKIPQDVLNALANSREDNVQLRLFDSKESKGRIGRLVRAASEIRFQTQELHEWLGSSLRFSRTEVEQGDGLDVNSLHLPPGGRTFMQLTRDWKRMAFLNRLGIHKLLAKVEAQPVAEAPVIIAVIGPSGYRQQLAAGRLMNRTWISLNSHGIAVHPYYVIADQLQRLATGNVPAHLQDQASALKSECDTFFGLAGGAQVQMLLRIGVPRRNPVRSHRLPLQDIFTEI